MDSLKRHGVIVRLVTDYDEDWTVWLKKISFVGYGESTINQFHSLSPSIRSLGFNDPIMDSLITQLSNYSNYQTSVDDFHQYFMEILPGYPFFQSLYEDLFSYQATFESSNVFQMIYNSNKSLVSHAFVDQRSYGYDPLQVDDISLYPMQVRLNNDMGASLSLNVTQSDFVNETDLSIINHSNFTFHLGNEYHYSDNIEVTWKDIAFSIDIMKLDSTPSIDIYDRIDHYKYNNISNSLSILMNTQGPYDLDLLSNIPVSPDHLLNDILSIWVGDQKYFFDALSSAFNPFESLEWIDYNGIGLSSGYYELTSELDFGDRTEITYQRLHNSNISEEVLITLSNAEYVSTIYKSGVVDGVTLYDHNYREELTAIKSILNPDSSSYILFFNNHSIPDPDLRKSLISLVDKYDLISGLEDRVLIQDSLLSLNSKYYNSKFIIEYNNSYNILTDYFDTDYLDVMTITSVITSTAKNADIRDLIGVSSIILIIPVILIIYRKYRKFN